MWFNDIIAIRSFMQTCALLKRDITRCISMVLEPRRPIEARCNTLYFNGFEPRRPIEARYNTPYFNGFGIAAPYWSAI